MRPAQNLGAAFGDFDIGYPVTLTPSKTILFAFPVETYKGMLELREIKNFPKSSY
jgi:hypothetical protein